MDNRLLLVKSITLLYRESQLTQRSDSSADLVRTVINTVQFPDVGVGINTEREVLSSLRDTVLEMCSNSIDYDYDKATILQRLKLNCGNDDRLYEVFQTSIEDDISEQQIKRSIVNLRKNINNHFREQQISDILNIAAYQFKHKRDKIKDTNEFVTQVISQLEPLQNTVGIKDPAVVSDIDIGNEQSLNEIFNEVKNISDGTGIMKTGWHAFNRMLQGGFRPRETVLIGALQHQFKTGFTLSLFSHLPLYNVPVLIDKERKPLILRISFEDDLVLNLQFLYQKLKYDETRQPITVDDIKNLEVEEMSAYVKQRLQVNGFHIKMMRVDPTQWGYRNLCSKVIELEAQGYEVKAVVVDYLFMLPTIGCVSTGPIGSDKRDMLRRVRNFFAARGTIMITPHQLSTEAKSLLRGGISGDQFVKDIAEKGYWDGCRTLDQECDVELYINLCKHNKETYLAVQRGKHRVPTILDDVDKFMLLKFPRKMPIPDDIEGDDTSYRKLPSASSNVDDSFFNFE